MKLISRLKEANWLKNILMIAIMIALFGYILCLPLFGQSKSILRYSIYLMMGFLGFLTFSYVFLFGEFKINRILLFVPVFALFALIGTAIHSHDFRSWFSLILLSISCFVLFYAFQSIKRSFLVLNLILAALFLFSLIFIYFYRKDLINFRSFGDKEFRLGGDFDNPNNITIFSLIGYSIALYFLLFFRKRIRFLYLFPIISILLMGLSTGSRTFFIGFILFTLIIFFFKFKKHKLLFIAVLILSVALFIFLINLPFLATLRSRFLRSINTIFGVGDRVDTSTIERTIWADYGIYLGSKHLLFGLGSKGFSVFSGTETYAHNNYSEVFCDFGLFGFILFYLPLAYCFIKNCFKKGSNSLAISFILYYVVAGFFNVFYYNKIYYLILALVFYLSFGDNRLMFKTILLPKITNMVIFANNNNEKQMENLKEYYEHLKIKCHLFYFDKNHNIFVFKNGSDSKEKLIQKINIRKEIIALKPDVVLNFSENLYFRLFLATLLLKTPYFNVLNGQSSKISLIDKLSFKSASGTIVDYESSSSYSKWLTNNCVILTDLYSAESRYTKTNSLLKYLLSAESDGGGF